MNNEKLVLLVQTGDKDALLTLWGQVWMCDTLICLKKSADTTNI